MDLSPEAVSLLVVFVVHFALFAWALRLILKADLTVFEKLSWILLCLVIPFFGVGIYATYSEGFFLKRELFELSLTILLIGFLFSFRMWGYNSEFSVSVGLNNLLRVTALAILAFGLHLGAQKLLARRYEAMAYFKIWWLGVALSLILVFITNGWFKWCALGVLAISRSHWRLGKKSDQAYITPFEKSKIVAAGAFTNIALAVVAKLISPSELMTQFMHMNLWIAVFGIIPFMIAELYGQLKMESKMHKDMSAYVKKSKYVPFRMAVARIGSYLSEGEIMLFGSRNLWVFTSTFVIFSAVFLLFLGAVLSIFLASILAITLLIFWHVKLEPKK